MKLDTLFKATITIITGMGIVTIMAILLGFYELSAISMGIMGITGSLLICLMLWSK